MRALMSCRSIYNWIIFKNVLSSVSASWNKFVELVQRCHLDMMKYFSSMHRLHRLLRFEYALAFARIFHETANSSFFSFSSHTYLLSSVALRFFVCLNDIWWLRHLVLNSVAVRPTYVSFFSLVVTVAWYTISFCKHSPSNGTLVFISTVARLYGLILLRVFGFP